MRSIVAAFLVVLAAAGTAPDGDGYRWIRLHDGTEILARGEVVRADGVVRYRAASGLLASVPERLVVAIEPASAPAAPGSAAAAPAAPEPSAAPPTVTNDDLPTAPLPSRARIDREGAWAVEAPPAGGGDPDGTEDAPAVGYAAYRDRDGHDEAWWRERTAGIAARRSAARDDLEQWTRRYRSLSDLVAIECKGRRFSTYLPAVCADYVRLQRDAAERAEAAQARLEEVEAERRGLSDEARRAGALPGWLR